jgi:hypothetical protein
MLRRAARERREFVYRKAIEQRQKAIEEKRERLKNALDCSFFFFFNLFQYISYLFYLWILKKNLNSLFLQQIT